MISAAKPPLSPTCSTGPHERLEPAHHLRASLVNIVATEPVELLLQSSDDVGHVGKLALLRSNFRLDPVQLPCPPLRAAERAYRYGLSVMQRRQLLQLGEQFLLDFRCGHLWSFVHHRFFLRLQTSCAVTRAF